MIPEHFLVTTDLSEATRRPLRLVGELAKTLGARVTLLHTVQTLTDPYVGGGMGAPISPVNYEKERASAEAALEQLAADFTPGVEHSTVVIQGPRVAEAIARYAEEQGVGMIALSTHGRTGVKRLVMGSVAGGVVRHATVPVLCFPPQESVAGKRVAIEHILVSTDLSDEATRPFASISALAKRLGAKVTLLNVVQDVHVAPHGAPLAPPVSAPTIEADVAKAREELAEQRNALAAELDVTMKVDRAESIAERIVSIAERDGADLIALSTHGRTGFRHLILGSVAEKVVRTSTVPVLTFPRAHK